MKSFIKGGMVGFGVICLSQAFGITFGSNQYWLLVAGTLFLYIALSLHD